MYRHPTCNYWKYIGTVQAVIFEGVKFHAIQMLNCFAELRRCGTYLSFAYETFNDSNFHVLQPPTQKSKNYPYGISLVL